MAAGVLLSYFVPISNWGIRTLDAVEPGLPVWSIPDFSAIGLKEAVIYSLSIAVVIMAETLLGENSFAQKNGYRVNANQELVAFPWESGSSSDRLLSDQRFGVTYRHQ